jgi:O-methyltransferase
MTTLAQYLKQATPAPVKAALRGSYMRLFRRHAYQAWQDYKYTDEHLKFVHILEAMNYVRVADIPSVYFEFGCHSGRTFSAAVRAAEFLEINDAEFFAFDSFQGLPEVSPAEDGVFTAGSFATLISDFVRLVKTMSGYDIPRKNIVEGFFDKSLTHELQRRMPKVGVVHIDVDLYSSTVEVLDFIKPLLVVGSVLIFDDWYCFPPGANKGESRAFNEFRAANPSFAFEEWKAYSTFGRSFFVTSVST